MPELKWETLDPWFINLDHRTDRLAHMNRELSRVGISAQRLRGLLPHEVRAGPESVRVMQNRTPGAIGTHYTQKSVIEHGARTGTNVLVMEDDLVFCDDFRKRFDYIAKFLNARPWQVCWLGGTVHINPAVWHKDTLGRDAETTDDPRMIRTYGAWSTYAYIVNGDSCAKVVKLLDDHVHESIGIDFLFIKFGIDLKQFMFLPGCVKQMDSKSDIGNGITYFSHFEKLGPYWFQSHMERFNPEKFNFGEAKK